MLDNNLMWNVHSLLRKWEEDLENKQQRLSETTNEDEAIQLSSGVQELNRCIEELEVLMWL